MAGTAERALLVSDKPHVLLLLLRRRRRLSPCACACVIGQLLWQLSPVDVAIRVWSLMPRAMEHASVCSFSSIHLHGSYGV